MLVLPQACISNGVILFLLLSRSIRFFKSGEMPFVRKVHSKKDSKCKWCDTSQLAPALTHSYSASSSQAVFSTSRSASTALSPPAVRESTSNLICCPECKRRISRYAETCPGCGFPLKTLRNVIESQAYEIALRGTVPVIERKIFAKRLHEYFPYRITIEEAEELAGSYGATLVSGLSFAQADTTRQLLALTYNGVIVRKSGTSSSIAPVNRCPKCGSTQIVFEKKALARGRRLSAACL